MRFLLVGTGFAETHLQWISEYGIGTVNVLAYHYNKERADTLAKKYAIAQVTDRPLEAVREAVVDAIAVVTPPDSHEALIRAGLDRGLVVVSDKPLAQSAAVARDLAEHAAAIGAQAAITFQWRGHPAFQHLRQLSLSGQLGAIFHLDLRFHHDFLAGPTTAWPWRHLAHAAGAGTLGDQGVHLFDLLRYLAPGDWQVGGAVTAITWPQRTAPAGPVNCDTEDLADILLTERDRGAKARIFVSRVDVGHREVGARIHGSTGVASVSLDPATGSGELHCTALGSAPVIIKYPTTSTNPYRFLMARFTGDGDPAAPEIAGFDDGYAAQLLLEQAVERAAGR